jgi:hypothetical protein
MKEDRQAPALLEATDKPAWKWLTREGKRFDHRGRVVTKNRQDN